MRYRLLNTGKKTMDRIILSLSDRRKRTAVALALLAITTLSVGFASATVKEGEFEGSAELKFCRKNKDGQWEVLDTLKISNVRFTASFNQITEGKAVADDLSFQGTTTKGRSVSVRALRAGKGVSNLTGGRAGLSLPLKITVDEKSVDVTVDITTETALAADGATIRGRRPEVDQVMGTVKFAMVGSAISNGLIAIFAPGPSSAAGTADLVHVSELRVVMRLDGKLPAVEQ